MIRMYAIAANTFRESIRDRVLYVLLFFAAVTIAGSRILGSVSVGSDEKVVIDVTLAAISVFGALVAIMVGTNLVYKEVDKRTVYTILSTSIQRYEFILGKFLGLAALIVLVCVLTGLMGAGYLFVSGSPVSATYFAAVYLIMVKLIVVTAASVMISSMTTPTLGAITAFSFYVVGHATGVLIDLPGTLGEPPASTILEFIYYITPNLANFDIGSEAANGVPVEWSYVMWASLYGAIYATLALVFAVLAFEDRDV